MSSLEKLEALLSDQRGLPPLERWDPELSGDIDIQIAADGRWFHEGDEIRRPELVALFASILRREADGDYYLLTPVEKWRIRVDDLPLLVVDFEQEGDAESGFDFVFKTNTQRWYRLEGEQTLHFDVDEQGQPQPSLRLPNGLAARVNRACFYRLVALAREEEGSLVLPLKDGAIRLGAVD